MGQLDPERGVRSSSAYALMITDYSITPRLCYRSSRNGRRAPDWDRLEAVRSVGERSGERARHRSREFGRAVGRAAAGDGAVRRHGRLHLNLGAAWRRGHVRAHPADLCPDDERGAGARRLSPGLHRRRNHGAVRRARRGRGRAPTRVSHWTDDPRTARGHRSGHRGQTWRAAPDARRRQFRACGGHANSWRKRPADGARRHREPCLAIADLGRARNRIFERSDAAPRAGAGRDNLRRRPRDQGQGRAAEGP